MRQIFWLIWIAISLPSHGTAVNGRYCNEVVIQLNKLNPGQMLRVQQGEIRINVYKRTSEEIEHAVNHVKSEFDSKYPEWWPQDKYPTKHMKSPERSVSPEYFVFWDASPMYSDVVTLINQEWFLESENIEFLGENLASGFIDYNHQIYYDTTGRSVKWGDKYRDHMLAKLPLLIPKYMYERYENTIKIQCK